MSELLNTKPNKILFVATFRHYFIGLGLAMNDISSNYHLIFINQKFDDERNPILNASVQVQLPFKTVRCFPLNASGALKKYKTRQNIFEKIRALVQELKPVEISTGNDRRIEYQYAMHIAREKMRLTVKGGYLDNGTGSYISFQKLEYGKYLARKWIDVPVKKLVYGSWFTRMQRFGGSDWTDKCYLTHPSLAPKRLMNKECVSVDVDWYKNDSENIIRRLTSILGLGDVTDINGESILLVLPRSTFVVQIYGSLGVAEKTIKEICSEFKNIYVKYHPADLDDFLGLSSMAVILPAQIPVELLYLVYGFSRVIGDTSTAILSAKWMLPNADVSYFDLDTPYTTKVKDLFADMGITPLSV